MLTLNWIRRGDGYWYDLLTLNLDHPYFTNARGVYVIWQDGTIATIRVGQGTIGDRLRVHLADPLILNYGHLGLKVTWAEVHDPLLDGIEKYLALMLRPAVGDRFPDADPIAVNLPGDQIPAFP